MKTVVRNTDTESEVDMLKWVSKYCGVDGACPRFIQYLAVHDKQPGTLGIITEYVNGGTWLDRRGVFLADPVRHTQQVVAGLRFLHRWGYIHSDIKPLNLMFHTDPQSGVTRSVIIDLGAMIRIGQPIIGGTAEFSLASLGDPGVPKQDFFALVLTTYCVLNTEYINQCVALFLASDAESIDAGMRRSALNDQTLTTLQTTTKVPFRLSDYGPRWPMMHRR